MIKELGLQMYSVREHLGTVEEVRDTMKKLKEMGYTVMQTAGQKITLEELADITNELGITVCGTHCGMDYLTDDVQKAMEAHRKLGTTNMGIGGFWGETKEDIQNFIEKANKLANEIYPHGFKFTYHNHSHEFMKIDGDKTIMDMLVEGLDPEKTSFCLDTYWLQNAGCDVCTWLEKLAGRIDILHLKEMGVNAEKQPFITEIGNGNMDFHKIIDVAEKIGVKYYVVEQDTCPGDSLDSVKKSAEYIKAHFMEK